MMKFNNKGKVRIISLILVLTLFSFGCDTISSTDDEKIVFIDSLGREVLVDQDIDRVVVSGSLAQNFVFALTPDKLVAVAGEWDDIEKQYIDTKYYDLPVLGKLYGGKGEMNYEELLAIQPQVIVDIGENKEGMASELDELQEQVGIPIVHIDYSLAETDTTFILLGELLGEEKLAKEYVEYWNTKYEMVTESIPNDKEKVNLIYITGDKGISVVARDSYHSEVIDLMCNNVAVVDNPSSKGTGNEIDMEQLLKWNPDYIIFAEESMYNSVGDISLWQDVAAIKNENYYKVPVGPDNWLGFPPSVHRLLGMMWMENVLYPEACNYELEEEVKLFFKMFYHWELTDEQYKELIN